MTISGNIKEDEKAAFDLICERTGVSPDQAKGVGFLNRLEKLCLVAKLCITLDYSQGENGRFKVSGVPKAASEPVEELVAEEPKEEVVIPQEKPVNPDLNKSDADEDEDPFA